MRPDDRWVQTRKIESCDRCKVRTLLSVQNSCTFVLTFRCPRLIVRNCVVHLPSLADETTESTDLLSTEVDVIHWNFHRVCHLGKVFQNRHLLQKLERKVRVLRRVCRDNRPVFSIAFELLEDLHCREIILLVAKIQLRNVVERIRFQVPVLPEPLQKIDLHNTRHIKQEELVLTKSVGTQITLNHLTTTGKKTTKITQFYLILPSHIIHTHLSPTVNIPKIVLPRVVSDRHISFFVLKNLHPSVHHV
ncbi:hypothetical protein PBCV1_a187L [Paramecium bursaria Chlorella virus 1]|uniref:Uncharacterized protein n=1 Tax=Paramecium bursaria Chlorella virus 1 TaxID=10506 RepID=Q84507_PBCV1|nr:hypothetical protein PBCV1_a187L [Paramecium bursaria Chlorella virus 1]AAC96555.1 hypothetical protein [Paramecium bursaria Chlorella virus 1]